MVSASTDPARPPRAAILGAGTRGAGWAARFVLAGWQVRLFDPDPGAGERLHRTLARARLALPGLSDRAPGPEGTLEQVATISEAVSGADWIHECLPERLALKRKALQKVQEHCKAGAVIASASAAMALEELQGCATRPGQIIAARGVDPVWLLPLAELNHNMKNAPELVEKADEILKSLGLFVVRSSQPVAAPLCRALGRAMDELRAAGLPAQAGSAALSHALAPLWAVTGGAAPAPEHDRALVAVLRALRATQAEAGTGVGAHLAALDQARAADDAPDITRPIPTLARMVPLDWTDYNGHMNEARYLQAFGDATDRFMQIIGVDAAYVAAGLSYFTAETHIRHVDEVHAGAVITIDTLCLLGEGKKMHLFHRMYEGTRLLATGEHLLIHVSLHTRRACPPGPEVARRLGEIAAAHARLPRPEGIGRAVMGGA